MAYTSEQRKVIRAIKRIGRRRGEGRVKIKAALETGAVESGYRNLAGGDADSAGWRQERASLYKNPTNVKASVNRFYDEADQLYHGQHAGRLAADVQRPAAQYRGRYGERSAEARALLQGGAVGPSSGGDGYRSRTTTTVPDTAARDATRRAAALAYLQDSNKPDALLNLALGVSSANQTKTNTTVTKASGGGGGGDAGHVRLPAGRYTPHELKGVKGTSTFEGKTVAAWIVPVLKYARNHGWTGSINSGYRSYAEQKAIYNSGVRPAAVPGTSNHEGDAFPRGAVDVNGADQLAKILQRSPYRHLLVYAGRKDPVHFSHPHNGSY